MDETIVLESSSDEFERTVMITDSESSIETPVIPTSVFKRQLSVQSITCEENKKLKISNNSECKEKSVVKLSEFLNDDPRLDPRLYYNRIDDTDIDYDLIAWAQLEVILDHVCLGSICFTVEHYYHQQLKKKRVYITHRHYERLKQEHMLLYRNKVPLFSKELFEDAKKELEHQISRTGQAGDAILQEARSFANFIKNIYGDKTIELF